MTTKETGKYVRISSQELLMSHCKVTKKIRIKENYYGFSSCKNQQFIAHFKRSLVWTVKKASLRCKQGFFEAQASLV